MKKRRETFIDPKSLKYESFPPIKYPPTATVTTSRQLVEQLAFDLVEMHNSDSFNLEYWPAAREFVTRFHTGEVKAKRRRG